MNKLQDAVKSSVHIKALTFRGFFLKSYDSEISKPIVNRNNPRNKLWGLTNKEARLRRAEILFWDFFRLLGKDFAREGMFVIINRYEKSNRVHGDVDDVWDVAAR